MEILTFQRAKELSEKKWQAIVNHNGEDNHIEKWVPEISEMRNECAMCQYVLVQHEEKCHVCMYNHTACGRAYSIWLSNVCAKTAQDVLDQIKKSNDESASLENVKE